MVLITGSDALSIRHLKSFIAVAETLHFGRAAERLALAQPAVTQRVQQLEAVVGVSLLARNRNGVALTEAGRVFLSDARRVVRQLDDALAAARGAERGSNGTLRIGFVGMAFNSIQAALRLIEDREPAMRVSLLEMTFDQITGALYDERIHAAIFRKWMPSVGLHTRDVSSGKLMVAVPATHKLAQNETISVAMLADERFVTFSRTIIPGYYEVLMSLCAPVNVNPNIVQEVFSAPAALHFVSVAGAIAIVPNTVARLHYDNVVMRPLDPPYMVPIALAWRPEAVPPLLETLFRILDAQAATS